MTDTKRQPKGIPVGGQFAESAHDEATSDLDNFLFVGGDETVTESGEGEWRSGGQINIELDDGTEIEIDTGSNYPTYIEPQYQALADGTVRVRYAVVDQEPVFEDEDEAVQRFSDIEDRNDFVNQKIADGYNPGQVQFVFLFTNGGQSGHEVRGSAADDGWEESTFGTRDYDVLMVGEPGEEGTTEEFAERAKGYLKYRNSVENGDVYAIIEQRFDRTGAAVGMSESFGGVVGHEEAESEVSFS